MWDIESGQQLRIFRNKILALGGFDPSNLIYPTTVAFSPNGKLLAMTTPESDRRDDKDKIKRVWEDDNQVERKKYYEVNLWNIETGQEVNVLRGEVVTAFLSGGREHDTTKIFTIRFSPDSKQIVIALGDDTARVLDIDSGQEITVLTHEGKAGTNYTLGVTYAIFSPDGKQVLSVGRDRTIRLWDINASVPFKRTDSWFNQFYKISEKKSSKQVAIFHGPPEGTWSAAFSPDGKKIVTTALDKTARLWDASSGKELAILTGHGGSVSYAAFSSDGNRLITVSSKEDANSQGNVAKLWSSDGQSSVVLHGHQDSVIHAAFSPDGKWLITTSEDKTTRLWNALTGQQPSIISNINNEVVFKINRDGTRMFTNHYNYYISYLWSNDGQRLATLRGSNAVFSNDGREILVYDNRYCESDNCYYDYDAFYLYDAKDGKKLAKLKSEKQRVFMASSYDKNGQQLIELREAAKNTRVFNVQFSPKGKFIVAISHLNVRIWDSSTGQELAVLPLFLDLTGRDSPFRCMDWARLSFRENNCVTFSSDEKLIAVADGDNTVGIWDINNGQKITTLRVNINSYLSQQWSNIWSIAFSPDGTGIITASSDKTNNARLWDIATGKELMTFSGHEDAIEDVAFSPDGRMVLTGSRDGTARVWDAKTAKELAVLGGHDGFVRQVSFSEDGRRIFAVSPAESSQRVFDAETFKLLAISTPLILNQHRNEIQAVLHNYAQKYEEISSDYHVDETALTTSNGAMLMPAFFGKHEPNTTLYWLPIFSGLDSLMSYTQKFLSRHEWTCEERRQFFLDISRCPERRSQERENLGHATYYLRFAEVGDLEMQYIVALSYLSGKGVVKNVEEGIKWLRKAAEQGHAPAQAALAGRYFQGTGVSQDYKESVKWSLKAAKQGQVEIQGLLCNMLVMYQTYDRHYVKNKSWQKNRI